MFSTTLRFEAKLLVPIWERSTWSGRGTQLHCLPKTKCFTGVGAQKKKKKMVLVEILSTFVLFRGCIPCYLVASGLGREGRKLMG